MNAKGKQVAARISAPNVYALTVDAALEVTRHCMTVGGRAGYFTPSMLLGSGFMASRPGVQLDWLT
ncbi:MAG TPA: hypothetical protein VGE22_06715 [Solimonas sp.]